MTETNSPKASGFINNVLFGLAFGMGFSVASAVVQFIAALIQNHGTTR